MAAALSLAALSAKDQERLRSGMRAPTVRTIRAGTTLYRFASSYDRFHNRPIPRERWATGAWWIDAQGFALIRAQRAQSVKIHGPARALTIGFLARQASAVKQEWSNVDALVTAHVVKDLEVFAGKGRAQHEEPDRSTGFWRYNVHFTWSGWDYITQLYLPWLDPTRPGYRVDGTKVLDAISYGSVESQQLV